MINTKYLMFYPIQSTFDKTVPLHTNPHYSDRRFNKEQTVFGKRDETGYGHTGLEYVYSDRLWQWDYEKAKQATESANQSEHAQKSCLWYETFLSAYLDQQVTIEHILAGVNVSNGYPYYVLGYRITQVEE